MTRLSSLSLPREVLLSPRTLYETPLGNLCRYVPYRGVRHQDQALFVYVSSAQEEAQASAEGAFMLMRPNWGILKVVQP